MKNLKMNQIFFMFFFLVVLVMFSNGAVMTVGPSGSYSDIQPAIDAALLLGGNNYIKLQQGTYFENLNIVYNQPGRILQISGGWNSTFTSAAQNPSLTVVNGNFIGGVISINCSGGRIFFQNISIRDGFVTGPTAQGAGVNAFVSGDSYIKFDRCFIIGNTTTSTWGIIGGGLSAVLSDNARFILIQCQVRNNRIEDTSGTSGGGIAAVLWDNSRFQARKCTIANNSSRSSGFPEGGGVYVAGSDQSFFSITGCSIKGNYVWTFLNSSIAFGGGIYCYVKDSCEGHVTDNIFKSNFSGGLGTVYGVGGRFILANQNPPQINQTTLVLQRNLWLENSDFTSTPRPFNVSLRSHDQGRILCTDSVLAKGNSMGLSADARDKSRIILTNLTVADATTHGIEAEADPNAAITIYNSISYGNGTNLSCSGPVSTGFNLVGINPLFVDPLSGNYSLQITSPAINSGDMNPPGGLGLRDVLRRPRAVDIVDKGAYERQ